MREIPNDVYVCVAEEEDITCVGGPYKLICMHKRGLMFSYVHAVTVTGSRLSA